MSTEFVVNYVRGSMWLPADIDLNGGVEWDELSENREPVLAMGIEQTTRRARLTRKRIPHGQAIRQAAGRKMNKAASQRGSECNRLISAIDEL